MSDTASVKMAVDHWGSTGDLITDGTARTIASWWQDPSLRGRPGASFATTGAISDPDDVVESLIAGCELTRTEIRDIAALRAYLEAAGPRGPVEGWSRVWAIEITPLDHA